MFLNQVMFFILFYQNSYLKIKFLKIENSIYELDYQYDKNLNKKNKFFII
jgi:hypothetical protein